MTPIPWSSRPPSPVILRPQAGAVAPFALLSVVYAALTIFAFVRLLVPGPNDFHNQPDGVAGLIVVPVLCLLGIFAASLYLTWLFGKDPMLVLDRDTLRFRPTPWRERVVRWDDVAWIEVRAWAGRANAFGPYRRVTLRVHLRPEARPAYRGRKRLKFRIQIGLLGLDEGDLAATLEEFCPIERTVVPA